MPNPKSPDVAGGGASAGKPDAARRSLSAARSDVSKSVPSSAPPKSGASPKGSAGSAVRPPAGSADFPNPTVRALVPYAAVFVVALALRLLFLIETAHTDAASFLMGDARAYDLWARQLAGGAWLGQGVFYQAPLYPYLMGLVYALGASSPVVIKVLQCLGGAVACVLLALAGGSFFSRRVGLAAGFLLAVYPPAIFFDGTIQNTSVASFLLVALLYCLADSGKGLYKSIRIGIVLGLAALTRENALIFVPVVFLWLLPAFPRSGTASPAARPSARWVLLGLAIVLLPVLARNRIAGGEFALTTSQLGSNLYIGNSPTANGGYVALVEGHGDVTYERDDATHLAEQATGRKLSPAQVSRFWTGRAIQWAASHPAAWLRLSGRKVALALNSVEMSDTDDMYTYTETSRTLRWTDHLLPFGVVLALAAAGFVLTWPERRRQSLLYLLAAAYGATLVLFYVMSRYRQPLALLAMLWAGVPLAWLTDPAGPTGAWLRRLSRSAVRPASLPGGTARVTAADAAFPTAPGVSRRYWIGAAVAAVLAAVIAFHPMADPRYFRAVMHSNIALGLMDQNRLDRALEQVGTALQLEPENANAHHLKGAILAGMGKSDEAEREYQTATALDPDRSLTWFKLAELDTSRGDFERAVLAYQRGLALEPDDAESESNLATALARLGRYPEALAHISRALALKPDLAGARYDQGLILAQAGRLPEAEKVFRSLLKDEPGNAAARQNLAFDLLHQGRTAEAVEQYEEVLRIDPARGNVKVRLAWILATARDDRVRNGTRARSLAEESVQSSRDPRVLAVLAAACAETGDFGRALEVAERARASADSAGWVDLSRAVALEADSYRHHRAWRADPAQSF